MKVVPSEQSDPRSAHARHVCNVCGEPSEMTSATSAQCSRPRFESLHARTELFSVLFDSYNATGH